MIGSVSNYSSYTSTSTANSARSQQFQKELLAKLDSNSDGSVDQDELSSALSQKSDDGILVSLSKNFSDLDSDSSASLSSEEMAAMAPPPPPPPQQASSGELFSQLDADSDGSVSANELSSALQVSDSSSTSTDQASVADALNKMIANLSKQYQLDNVATVGKHLNVAT